MGGESPASGTEPPHSGNGPPGDRALGESAPARPSASVWARVRDHKVAQWTLAYVAGAYALLNGVEMVSNALDWPHEALVTV